MPDSKKKFRFPRWAGIGILLLILFVGIFFTLYFYRINVIRYLGKSQGFDISIRALDFSYQEGLVIHLANVVVKEETVKKDVFRLDELRLSLPPFSTLFSQKFQIKEMVIKHPHLILFLFDPPHSGEKDKKTQLSERDIPSDKVVLPWKVGKIVIQEGQVTIIGSMENWESRGMDSGIAIKNISCLASVDQSQPEKYALTVKKLSLSAFGGEIEAQGTFDLIAAETPGYALDFEGKELRQEQINRAIGLKPERIKGKVVISGHLENNGRAKVPISGLNGKITFSIHDGMIKEFSMLSKIFALLSPEAYTKGEIPDVSAEGFVFRSINGVLTINNGVGRLDETLLKSDSWNILAKGKLDFTKEDMDLDVYIQPFQTLDAIVAWVPMIGKILKEENRGVLDVYVKVKGKMEDPEVEFKPIANLGEQVFGILKRVLTLPLEVLPNDDRDPDSQVK